MQGTCELVTARELDMDRRSWRAFLKYGAFRPATESYGACRGWLFWSYMLHFQALGMASCITICCQGQR